MADGVETAPKLKVIGQRLPRVDARERVTGEARYPADLALPGRAILLDLVGALRIAAARGLA